VTVRTGGLGMRDPQVSSVRTPVSACPGGGNLLWKFAATVYLHHPCDWCQEEGSACAGVPVDAGAAGPRAGRARLSILSRLGLVA
jgi:hypothetical protein